MPAMEQMDRHQDAAIFVRTGVDAFSESEHAAPVDHKVRWTWSRSFSTDANGNKIALDAKVVTAMAVPVGSLMYLGTVDAWYGTGSAGNDTELCEVVTDHSGPSLCNKFYRYSYGLKRYRNGQG